MRIEKGLKRGTYLVMYQAEFTEDYAERQLVVSLYCNTKVPMSRVSVANYDQSWFNEFKYALEDAVYAEEEARMYPDDDY